MIQVFRDVEELSEAAADRFIELVRERDTFSVALSGGSTPKRMYEILAGRRNQVDWSKVHIYWGDERYVPPADPRSNERMTRQALLSKAPIPPENIHPIYRPVGWHEAATLYERELRAGFPGPTTFDLALQGMGEDGHTASIFPTTPEPPPGSWVVATDGPGDAPERISATLPILARSRNVLFLVSGASKADRVKEVLSPGCTLPAARLVQTARGVEWWLDQAAAAKL